MCLEQVVTSCLNTLALFHGRYCHMTEASPQLITKSSQTGRPFDKTLHLESSVKQRLVVPSTRCKLKDRLHLSVQIFITTVNMVCFNSVNHITVLHISIDPRTKNFLLNEFLLKSTTSHCQVKQYLAS